MYGYQWLHRRRFTVCSWKASLLNVLACVSSGHQLLCRSSCTVCKRKASLHYEPACVFSEEQLWYLSSRIGCNCGTSFHHAFLSLLPFRRWGCAEHRSKVYLQSVFPSCDLSWACVLSSIMQHSLGITEENINFSWSGAVFEKRK